MGDDHPIVNGHDDIEIGHETGWKDDYLVKVNFNQEVESWAPTNEQIFKLLEHMFVSEDVEFGDGGYGRWMLWFNISLIALGEEEDAFEGYDKSGVDALNHFDDVIEKHADDIIRSVLKIKDGDRESLPKK